MDNKGKLDLIELLIAAFSAGDLSQIQFLEAVRALQVEREKPVWRPDLIAHLTSSNEPALAALCQRFCQAQLDEIAVVRRSSRNKPVDILEHPNLSHLPLNAATDWQDLYALGDLERLLRALHSSESAEGELSPSLKEALYRVRRAPQFQWLVPLDPNSPAAMAAKQDAVEAVQVRTMPLPTSLREDDVFAAIRAAWSATKQTDDPDMRRYLQTAIMSWPGKRAAQVALELLADGGDAFTMAEVVALRFGVELKSRGQLENWLNLNAQAGAREHARLEDARALYPAELRLLPTLGQEQPVAGKPMAEPPRPALPTEAESPVLPDYRSKARDRAADFAARLAAGQEPSPAPEPVAAPLPPQVVSVPVVPPPPPPPAEPGVVATLWNEHVRPFVTENWYLMAGLLMVISGATLVTWFLWDRTWLVRYTAIPGLLLALTWGLARSADWLESRQKDLRAIATFLRGAAIELLPANFMVAALLASDLEVPGRTALALLAGGAYAAFFGLQLRRWLARVHNSLGWPLVITLLGLNGLVVLLPLTLTAQARIAGVSSHLVVAAGFYVGFVLAAWCFVDFTRRVMTREMLAERIVPAFVGVVLVATYLQVMLWVYGRLREVPQPWDYSLIVVATGALVLFFERHCSRLASNRREQTGESFLGYALILLGVLMSLGQPWLRLIALALAGAVWLWQAASRRGLLHQWIGLAALLLAGATLAGLPGFPLKSTSNGLPWLGLGLALGVGIIRIVSAQLHQPRLALAARETQPLVIVLAAVVTILSQWHLASNSASAGIVLAILAVLMAYRAVHQNRDAWTVSAAMLAALVLPYAGCVDMKAVHTRGLFGNLLPFGLGVLSLAWLAIVHFFPRLTLRRNRSTVLLIYGALALAAMLVRVVFEQGRPGESYPVHSMLDLVGPLMMFVALLFATYYSRSMMPIALAGVMVVVLLPGLRGEITRLLPFITWGSGLGSAVWSLCFAVTCLGLQRAPFLRSLGPGDRFFQIDYPVRRYNHSLFTLPLMGMAVFLAGRVLIWNLPANMDITGVPGIKTCAAILVSALTWVTAAVYSRRRQGGRLFLWPALIAILVGFHYLCCRLEHPYQIQRPIVLSWLSVLALWMAAVAGNVRYPWLENLIVVPTRKALTGFGVVGGVIAIFMLADGSSIQHVNWLSGFAAVQLTWSALSVRAPRYGWLLFALGLTLLTAVTLPGHGLLISRLSPSILFEPILLTALGIQLIQIALEFAPRWLEFLRPILAPFQTGATLLSLGFAVFTAAAALDGAPFFLLRRNHTLLIAALLTSARANRSALVALVAACIAYIAWRAHAMAGAHDYAQREWLLLQPLTLQCWSLALALLAAAGCFIHKRAPRLITGPALCATSPWDGRLVWLIPAVMVTMVANGLFFTDPVWRDERLQLACPYLGTITLIFVAWFTKLPALLPVAIALLALANIRSVFLLFETQLRGIFDLQRMALGLAATLGMVWLTEWKIPGDSVRRYVRWSAVTLACLILAGLAANYLTNPGLEHVTALRFAVSGALALFAAFYFRWASRHSSGEGNIATGAFADLYLMGLTVAIWCFALMIPWLRTPNVVLAVVGLPALVFWIRAELALGSPDELQRAAGIRWRNSAATLCYLVVGLYAFRGVFQLLLFPDSKAAVNFMYYHWNAPVIIAAGLLMLRLRGLGGDFALAVLAGLAFTTGIYMLGTGVLDLSPFKHPMRAAWAAIAAAHLFISLCYQRSPLKTFVTWVGKLDEPTWSALCVYWRTFVVAASTVLVVLGVGEALDVNTYMVAPLILGLATVFFHVGVVARTVFHLAIGLLLLLLALHADFFTPSWLGRNYVVGVLLGVWAAALVAVEFAPPVLRTRQFAYAAAALFALCFVHLLWHRPWTDTGLSIALVMAMLSALTPRETTECARPSEYFFAALILIAPLWLAFFSQVNPGNSGRIASEVWPAIFTMAVLALMSLAIGAGQRIGLFAAWRANPLSPRTYKQTLGELERDGNRLEQYGMILAMGVAIAAMAMLYTAGYSQRIFLALAVIWGTAAYSWFQTGWRIRAAWPFLLAQGSAIAFFLVARRRLEMYKMWTPEYDVWVALTASVLITGIKRGVEKALPEVRLATTLSLLTLPVLALLWIVCKGLGTNLALLVLSLNSLIFAFVGRDERESPYNVLAILGFVAFFVVLFARFQFTSVPAYTIPVGIGVLSILHLQGRRLATGTRETVESITIAVMLGSTALTAIIDRGHSLGFHALTITLCLAAMGLGSLLRVRLYFLMGFGGLVVDVVAIVWRAVATLEGQARNTAMGALLLLVGVAVVVGSVFVKLNRPAIDDAITRFKTFFTRER